MRLLRLSDAAETLREQRVPFDAVRTALGVMRAKETTEISTPEWAAAHAATMAHRPAQGGGGPAQAFGDVPPPPPREDSEGDGEEEDGEAKSEGTGSVSHVPPPPRPPKVSCLFLGDDVLAVFEYLRASRPANRPHGYHEDVKEAPYRHVHDGDTQVLLWVCSRCYSPARSGAQVARYFANTAKQSSGLEASTLRRKARVFRSFTSLVLALLPPEAGAVTQGFERLERQRRETLPVDVLQRLGLAPNGHGAIEEDVEDADSVDNESIDGAHFLRTGRTTKEAAALHGLREMVLRKKGGAMFEEALSTGDVRFFQMPTVRSYVDGVLDPTMRGELKDLANAVPPPEQWFSGTLPLLTDNHNQRRPLARLLRLPEHDLVNSVYNGNARPAVAALGDVLVALSLWIATIGICWWPTWLWPTAIFELVAVSWRHSHAEAQMQRSRWQRKRRNVFKRVTSSLGQFDPTKAPAERNDHGESEGDSDVENERDRRHGTATTWVQSLGQAVDAWLATVLPVLLFCRVVLLLSRLATVYVDMAGTTFASVSGLTVLPDPLLPTAARQIIEEWVSPISATATIVLARFCLVLLPAPTLRAIAGAFLSVSPTRGRAQLRSMVLVLDAVLLPAATLLVLLGAGLGILLTLVDVGGVSAAAGSIGEDLQSPVDALALVIRAAAGDIESVAYFSWTEYGGASEMHDVLAPYAGRVTATVAALVLLSLAAASWIVFLQAVAAAVGTSSANADSGEAETSGATAADSDEDVSEAARRDFRDRIDALREKYEQAYLRTRVRNLPAPFNQVRRSCTSCCGNRCCCCWRKCCCGTRNVTDLPAAVRRTVALCALRWTVRSVFCATLPCWLCRCCVRCASRRNLRYDRDGNVVPHKLRPEYLKKKAMKAAAKQKKKRGGVSRRIAALHEDSESERRGSDGSDSAEAHSVGSGGHTVHVIGSASSDTGTASVHTATPRLFGGDKQQPHDLAGSYAAVAGRRATRYSIVNSNVAANSSLRERVVAWFPTLRVEDMSHGAVESLRQLVQREVPDYSKILGSRNPTVRHPLVATKEIDKIIRELTRIDDTTRTAVLKIRDTVYDLAAYSKLLATESENTKLHDRLYGHSVDALAKQHANFEEFRQEAIDAQVAQSASLDKMMKSVNSVAQAHEEGVEEMLTSVKDASRDTVAQINEVQDHAQATYGAMSKIQTLMEVVRQEEQRQEDAAEGDEVRRTVWWPSNQFGRISRKSFKINKLGKGGGSVSFSALSAGQSLSDYRSGKRRPQSALVRRTSESSDNVLRALPGRGGHYVGRDGRRRPVSASVTRGHRKVLGGAPEAASVHGSQLADYMISGSISASDTATLETGGPSESATSHDVDRALDAIVANAGHETEVEAPKTTLADSVQKSTTASSVRPQASALMEQGIISESAAAKQSSALGEQLLLHIKKHGTSPLAQGARNGVDDDLPIPSDRTAQDDGVYEDGSEAEDGEDADDGTEGAKWLRPRSEDASGPGLVRRTPSVRFEQVDSDDDDETPGRPRSAAPRAVSGLGVPGASSGRQRRPASSARRSHRSTRASGRQRTVPMASVPRVTTVEPALLVPPSSDTRLPLPTAPADKT